MRIFCELVANNHKCHVAKNQFIVSVNVMSKSLRCREHFTWSQALLSHRLIGKTNCRLFSPPPAFPFRENIRRLRCFLASSHANTKPCSIVETHAASFARVATLLCEHALAMYVMRPWSPKAKDSRTKLDSKALDSRAKLDSKA